MDPKIEERLVALEVKIEDNNTVLHKIYRSQRSATIFRVTYWTIILLISVGAFYFVQPFMDQIKDTYGIGSNTDTSAIKDLINQYKGIQSDR